MSQRTFSLVPSLIFLLIAVMHVLRLAFKWEVVLDGWSPRFVGPFSFAKALLFQA
jgi:hypothetical protein